MTDIKDRLVHLVNVEDFSAIQLLAGEIGLSEDDTRDLLEEILQEGLIEGYITEDGKRIFKKQVELSDKPVIKSEETLPDFLNYNTTPGRVVAIIGIIICIISLVFLSTSGGIIYYENLGLILLLLGIITTMLGAYWIGRMKTP